MQERDETSTWYFHANIHTHTLARTYIHDKHEAQGEHFSDLALRTLVRMFMNASSRRFSIKFSALKRAKPFLAVT